MSLERACIIAVSGLVLAGTIAYADGTAFRTSHRWPPQPARPLTKRRRLPSATASFTSDRLQTARHS